MRPSVLERSVSCALFGLLVLLATAAEGGGRRRLVARIGSPEAQWVRARAMVLESADPAAPLDDLAPLASAIGDATVVTLGEGTHFTAEFQTMHHRVIRLLAESLGFRTFAFEASWPNFRAIDDYLRSGEGDPVALLEDPSWNFWDTEEMADLLRWARAWNASHPESDWISFAGVDPSVPARLVADVLDYLQRVDPSARTAASTALACLKSPGEYMAQTASYRTACRASLQSVADGLAAKRSTYESAAGVRAFSGAARSAAMILQAERVAGAGLADFDEARDEAMAENVRLLAQQSAGGKVVYRGHNAHASANGYLSAGRRFDSTGTFLRRDLGAQLFALGTTSSRGTYVAADTGRAGLVWSVFPFPAPLDDSWESILESVGYPAMIVPLREPLPDWTRAPRPFFNFITVGRRPDPTEYAPADDLPALFDAVVYVRETTPTHRLH